MEADVGTTDHSRRRVEGRWWQRFPEVVALLVGVMFVVFGAWAFFAPESFFEQVASFEPYNTHFVRDIGSFQVGLGAVLLMGVLARDGLVVALSGVAVGTALHAVSHVVDRSIGGEPEKDIPLFTVVAVLLIAAAVARVVALVKRERTA